MSAIQESAQSVKSIADLDCNDVSSACGEDLHRPSDEDDSFSHAMMLPPNMPRMVDIGKEIGSLHCHEVVVVDNKDDEGQGKKMVKTTFPRTRGFPHKLRFILHIIDGNSRCVNCALKGTSNSANGDESSTSQSPTWALIKYGVLICGQCAFHHMTIMGEDMQSVIPLETGYWRLHDVLFMLEGGNKRLMNCFNERADRKASYQTPSKNLNTGEDRHDALKRTNSLPVKSKSKRLLKRFTSRNYATSSRNRATSTVDSKKEQEFSIIDDHYQSRTAALYRKDLFDRVEAAVAMHVHGYRPKTTTEDGARSRPQNTKQAPARRFSPNSQRRLLKMSSQSQKSLPPRLPEHGKFSAEGSSAALARNMPLASKNFDSNSTTQQRSARSLGDFKGSSQNISALTFDSMSARSLNASSRSLPISQQEQDDLMRRSKFRFLRSFSSRLRLGQFFT